MARHGGPEKNQIKICKFSLRDYSHPMNRSCAQTRFNLLCILLLLFCGPICANAFDFTGKVVGIADGDTITVLHQNTQQKIRLEHIDAPEGRQAFGAKAKQALSAKVFGKLVTIRWTKRDRYKRIIGEVWIGPRFINAEMVADGMAWHYKQYSKNKIIAAAESKARTLKQGLWSDATAVAPWDFRKKRTNTTQPRPPPKPTNPPVIGPAGTVYVTKLGSKYHRANCSSLSKSKIPILLQRALKAYGPCGRCNPPIK